MPDLLEAITGARVFDLAQPYFTGMPHYPTHPPFLFGLTKQHGDSVGPAGNSSAADAIALGSHVGTHIDALCHFSRGGKLYGGVEVAAAQSYGGGLRQYPVDTIAPILRRGVLLCPPIAKSRPKCWIARKSARSAPEMWFSFAPAGRATSKRRANSSTTPAAPGPPLPGHGGSAHGASSPPAPILWHSRNSPIHPCRSTFTSWWKAASTSSSV